MGMFEYIISKNLNIFILQKYIVNLFYIGQDPVQP